MTQNVSLKSQVYRLLKCNFNDPYNIAFFVSIFKMAVVRHFGIKLKFLTVMHFRDKFCVIMLKFMEICRIVAEILQFFAFI